MTRCAKCGHELREELDPDLRAVTTYPCSCRVNTRHPIRELNQGELTEMLTATHAKLPVYQQHRIDVAANNLILGVKERQYDARIGVVMAHEVLAAIGRWLLEDANTPGRK